MSKETAADRLKKLKEEKEAARAAAKGEANLVDQLTHGNAGEPDFSEIAKKLAERKAQEAKGENDGYRKLTIYIEESVANAFNALITKRGQQKEFANQAFKDFIQKKAKELDLDKYNEGENR